MADTDFKISIVTTADTSGIKDTAAAFEDLRKKASDGAPKITISTAETEAEAKAGVARFTASQAAAQAAIANLAGGGFAQPLVGVPKELTEDLEKAAPAVAKTAEEIEKAEQITSQWRYATASVVSELLKGQVTAQGLSRQFPLLGVSVGAVAGAALLEQAIVNTIKAATQLESELATVHNESLKMGSAEGPEAFSNSIKKINQDLLTLTTEQQALSGGLGFANQSKALADALTRSLAGQGTLEEQQAERQRRINQLRQDGANLVNELGASLDRQAASNEVLLTQGQFAAEQKKIQLEYDKQRQEIANTESLTFDQRGVATQRVNRAEAAANELLDRRRGILEGELNLRQSLIDISEQEQQAEITTTQAKVAGLEARKREAELRAATLPAGSEEQRKAQLDARTAQQAIQQEAISNVERFGANIGERFAAEAYQKFLAQIRDRILSQQISSGAVTPTGEQSAPIPPGLSGEARQQYIREQAGLAAPPRPSISPAEKAFLERPLPPLTYQGQPAAEEPTTPTLPQQVVYPESPPPPSAQPGVPPTAAAGPAAQIDLEPLLAELRTLVNLWA